MAQRRVGRACHLSTLGPGAPGNLVTRQPLIRGRRTRVTPVSPSEMTTSVGAAFARAVLAQQGSK